MSLSRRKTLALIGGGAVLAASAGAGFAVTRAPRTAQLPWGLAGRYEEPRRRALSWALLAPNPHNRQPWLADLSEEGVVTLHADPGRLLPHTDPYSRQIVIGLGCFLEIMRMAAAEDGYRVDLALFPEGEDPLALDDRPIARATFTADPAVARDPLFAQVPHRRTLKEPFDTARPVPPEALPALSAACRAGSAFGGTLDPAGIAELRALTHEALRIEIETPHTYRESVDLFRIGRHEVDANPDGIDFTGPLFEGLRLAGLFTRAAAADPASAAYRAGLDAVFANTDTAMGHLWLVTAGNARADAADPASAAYRAGLDAVFANTDTAMGHLWLVTAGNARADQIAAGADWVRVNFAATALGLGLQPLSQALQEYPEMAGPYRDIHARLAPGGGTVQMLARVGYGPGVGPSPRWPLDAKIVGT